MMILNSKTAITSTPKVLCGLAALLMAIVLYPNCSNVFEIKEMDEPKVFDFAAALEAVSNSTRLFSDKLFKEVMKTENGKNTVMSPLSAHIALGMTTYGAQGKTFDQMKTALQLPEDDKFAQVGFKKLLEELNNVGDVTLEMADIAKAEKFEFRRPTIDLEIVELQNGINKTDKVTTLEVANKMYIAKGLELKSKFKELTSNSFNSEIGELDVYQPEKAAKNINSWVKDKTHDKIDKIIDEDDISEDTAMILLNAVYFKSTWDIEFDAKDTKDRIFNLIGGRQINVPTMWVRGNLDHGSVSGLNARYIRLSYANLDLEMLIVVPNEIDGIYRVIDNLEILRFSNRFNRSLIQVELHLPKFKIESNIDLKQPLRELGMTDMFGLKANFRGISDEPLKVSKILQKAFIEVNEKGSEAAAVTKTKTNNDWLRKFPIYGAMLVKNVQKGIKRRKLFDKSAVLLSDYLPM